MDQNNESRRVIFETDETSKFTPITSTEEIPLMVKWIFKLSKGKVKDQRQAEVILLLLSIIIIVVSLILIFTSSPNKNNSQIEELPDQSQFMVK